MKKLILYSLLLLSMPVFSQVTRTVAESKIDSLLPDNSARQITPARLRAAAKILLDYAESLDTASVQIGNRTVKGMLDVQRGPLSIKMGGYWNDTTRSTGQYNGGMIGVSSYYPGTQLLIMGSSLASGNFIKVGGGEAGYMAANLISEYTTATPGATIGSIRRYVFGSGRHWFGSSPVDDGVNLVTVNGAANIKGNLTTQDLTPAAGSTYQIGTEAYPYTKVNSYYFLSPLTAIFGARNTTNDIQIWQGSSSATVAGWHKNTGNFFVQSRGNHPVDNGFRLQNHGSSYLGGDVTITGTTTTQNVVPDGNNTRDLGAGGARWNNVYGANFLINSSAAVTFGSINSASPIQFRQGNSSQLIAGFFPTSGRMFLQAASTIPTDNGVDQLQVIGSANFTSGIKAQGNWADYQATFGSTGQAGRIAFNNGVNGGVSMTLGLSAATGNNGVLTSSLSNGLVVSTSGTSGPLSLAATGASGTVRIQTGATERVRIHPDGAVTFDPSGAHVNTGLYNLDNIGNMRTSGTFTLNDGVIEKTTGGNYLINGGAVAVNATIRANSGVLAGGTNSLDPSAILEARSTTKGMLPPRHTEVQKSAIASPASGLIVYQLDGSEGLWVKTSTGWRKLAFEP